MSIYISRSSCISCQNTTGGKFQLIPIREMKQQALLEPNYKELLKPALLRRMSKILKMGNYSAKAVLTDNAGNVNNPDAIIVGTGLGCISDTISFLEEVIRNDEQTLAPTAFIQSTHNSIAGQIALMLQNYRYNMTIAQKSLSFEMALLDAELQLETSDASTVLVGAADELSPELIKLLNELAEAMDVPLPALGEGAAFFLATAKPASDTIATVEQIASSTTATDSPTFFTKNKIDPADFDLILNGGPDISGLSSQQLLFKDYCGEYFTAPAFATHLALEMFRGNVQLPHTSVLASLNRILILNTFGGHNGATALKRFEI